MQNLQTVEARGQRVLTTKQIAAMYEVGVERIKLNHKYNRNRFIEGKHYFSIIGDNLKEFKRKYQFDTSLKYAKCLYLWTEKGALLHAKSLNTDKAWEVYEWLVDFYFRVKEGGTAAVPVNPKPAAKPRKENPLDIPGNMEAQERIQRIKNHCISMRCVLDLYNRYIGTEDARGLNKAMDAIGTEISLDVFRLQRIKIAPKAEL